MANYINDLGKEIKNCKAGIGLSEILDGESVHNIPESLLFINIMLTILCALLTMSKTCRSCWALWITGVPGGGWR